MFETPKERYTALFSEVCRRTARLVAQWQCLGWCHGVLNTDNMSIVGLTIDYGPFGWMGHFDPKFVCNSSDTGGRYSYENQPGMCRWNCGKLADALSLAPSLEGVNLRAALPEAFDAEYQSAYEAGMRSKLGLSALPCATAVGLDAAAEDSFLIGDLLRGMATTGADFTRTFVELASVQPLQAGSSTDPAAIALAQICADGEGLASSLEPRVRANASALYDASLLAPSLLYRSLRSSCKRT